MRRSGPCDFEKLRMWTVCSGSHVPRLIAGVDATAPAESSSTMKTGLAFNSVASSRALFPLREAPVGL